MHFMQASNSRTRWGELSASTVAKHSSICRSRMSSCFSQSKTACVSAGELTESAAFATAAAATSNRLRPAWSDGTNRVFGGEDIVRLQGIQVRRDYMQMKMS